MYFFNDAVLGIFLLSSLLLLPVLLPVAATSKIIMDSNDTTSVGAFDDLDKFSMGHVQVNAKTSPSLFCILIFASMDFHLRICLFYPCLSVLYDTGRKSPVVGVRCSCLLGFFRHILPLMEGIQTRL